MSEEKIKYCDHCGIHPLDDKNECRRCDVLCMKTVREYEWDMHIDPRKHEFSNMLISHLVGDPCTEEGRRKIKLLGL